MLMTALAPCSLLLSRWWLIEPLACYRHPHDRSSLLLASTATLMTDLASCWLLLSRWWLIEPLACYRHPHDRSSLLLASTATLMTDRAACLMLLLVFVGALPHCASFPGAWYKCIGPVTGSWQVLTRQSSQPAMGKKLDTICGANSKQTINGLIHWIRSVAQTVNKQSTDWYIGYDLWHKQ